MLQFIRKKYAQIKKIPSLTLTLIFFMIFIPYRVGSNESYKDNNYYNNKNKVRLIPRDSLYKIKPMLEIEIANYIKKNAPTSKISPSLFLSICKNNNFDIVLAMSQAHIESHYGTKGIAAMTNSVFNVGTYDDGTIKYRYKDPNHSIEPYTILMNNNYLQGIKTTDDILRAKSFVDYRGKRYASFKHYELRVKKIYDSIIEDTNIDNLYQIYNSKHYDKSIQFYNIINTIDATEYILSESKIYK